MEHGILPKHVKKLMQRWYISVRIMCLMDKESSHGYRIVKILAL